LKPETQLAQQGRLSPSGIAEQIRRHATKNYAGQLAKARKTIEDARAQLQQRRQSLGMPKIDRNDLLAAHLRSEARAYLRSLPISERQTELSKADPLYIAAVVEAPLGMSGVSLEMRDRTIGLYLRQHFDAIRRRSEPLVESDDSARWRRLFGQSGVLAEFADRHLGSDAEGINRLFTLGHRIEFRSVVPPRDGCSAPRCSQ
jgi:hypothetical protein